MVTGGCRSVKGESDDSLLHTHTNTYFIIIYISATNSAVKSQMTSGTWMMMRQMMVRMTPEQLMMRNP